MTMQPSRIRLLIRSVSFVVVVAILNPVLLTVPSRIWFMTRYKDDDNVRHFPEGVFSVLDPEHFRAALGDSFQWATCQVPFVDFSHFNNRDSHTLSTTYYYRWRVLHKHLVYTGGKNEGGDGWVVTEFLPSVPWAGKHNTIPAAAGHHIREGRWLHSERYLDDYIKFWASWQTSGANPFSYTNWIADSTWQRYLVTGKAEFLLSVRDGLATMWDKMHSNHWLPISFAGDKMDGCYWQYDGADAMEVSVSGDGCRPTIASAMHGNALAISQMGELLKKDHSMVKKFLKHADNAKNVVLNLHWSDHVGSFAVVPTKFEEKQKPRRAGTVHNRSGDCNLANVRIENRTVAVRELLAFMPYYFSSIAKDLVADVNNRGYLQMYKQLMDPDAFASPWGLRTAELRSNCYNYSWEHGDCWNGPSWPYETSRVLTGMANILEELSQNDEQEVAWPSPALLYSVLLDYARQHTDTYAINDTAVPLGSGHVFENLHPDEGHWNHRQILYGRNDENKDMGNDYFHSTFNDIILSCLFGIRPLPGNEGVRISPNVPGDVAAWAVDNLLIREKHCALVWDNDGSVYGVGRGLSFIVDGVVLASTERQEDGLYLGSDVLPLV